MAVYKFKIVIEDNDDIYREIEILSGQTFEDFHYAIQEAFKFDKKHTASFFTSDDYWRKEQEITLHKENLELDEDEIRKGVPPKKLMSATKIAKYIESPRQRFVYVFDPVAKWTFCIELMKILPDNPKGNYPTCVKSIGNAPKQYKSTTAPKIEALDPLAALLGGGALHNEPDANDESEIYKAIKNDTNGIDEGDLNHLEGEEGEDDHGSDEHDDDMMEDDDMDEGDGDDYGGGYGDGEDEH